MAGAHDYDYSPALRRARAAGLVWDRTRLERFLEDPEAMFPGMWMSYPGIEDPEERRALVGYVAQGG